MKAQELTGVSAAGRRLLLAMAVAAAGAASAQPFEPGQPSRPALAPDGPKSDSSGQPAQRADSPQAGGTLTDQAVSLVYTSGHWSSAPNASLYGTETGVNPLFRSGWWYRVVGVDTREYPFPPPDSEVYGADGRLVATWNNVDGKGFTARETTWVFDEEGPSGGFTSEVFVDWGTNPAPHEIALFHLLDVDVAGSFAGDSAALRGPGYIKITDGSSTVRYRGYGGQPHYLVAPYDNLYGGDVKRRLNDALVDDFGDTGLPFGPGDVTAGMQFRAYTPYGSARVSVGNNQARDYVRGQDYFLAPGPGLLFRYPAGADYSYQWVMRRGALMAQYSGYWYGFEPLAYNDFDADGSGDALVRNLSTGALRIDYDFVTGAGPLAANWRLGASHDFDADGKADLLWFNTSSRKLVIWLMNGPVKVGARTPNPDQAVDANWDLAGAADADGDGDADLLWYNQTTGRLVIWTLDGNQVRVSGNFTDPPSVGSNVWRAVAWGDYGRGLPSAPFGTPDVVWQNDVSKKLVLWYMDFAGRRVSGGFTTPDVCAPCNGGAVFGPR